MPLYARKITNIKISRDGSTASEEWLCPWTEAILQGKLLEGGYQTVFGVPVYLPPATFPEMPGLQCNGVDIEPFGDQTADDYLTARLKVSYGTNKAGDDNGDPKDIAEITVSIAAEALQIPPPDEAKIFQWASGPKSGEDIKQSVPSLIKWLPLAEINVKFKFKPSFDIEAFAGLAAMVNDATVSILGADFDEQTLLFMGANTSVAITTDGTKGFGRDIKLVHKQSGWNYLYDPEIGSFNRVTPELYEGAGFDPLWAD